MPPRLTLTRLKVLLAQPLEEPHHALLPWRGLPQELETVAVKPPEVKAESGTTAHVVPPSVEYSSVPPSQHPDADPSIEKRW